MQYSEKRKLEVKGFRNINLICEKIEIPLEIFYKRIHFLI